MRDTCTKPPRPWLAWLLGLAVAGPGQAAATEAFADEWTARKCEIYQQAVRDAISLQGPEGLRMAFLTSNQEFIDAQCAVRVEICPMTPEEWTLADTLLKMTMNEGMASTFVPFGCP